MELKKNKSLGNDSMNMKIEKENSRGKDFFWCCFFFILAVSLCFNFFFLVVSGFS